MKDNKMVLPSIQKGFVSKYVSSIFGIIIFYLLSQGNFFSKEIEKKHYLPLNEIVWVISFLLMVGITLSTLHTLFYSAREVNTLHLSKEGFWNKLKSREYCFPFSIKETAIHFDWIDISIQQTIIDKWLNTGLVRLNLRKFADSRVTSWLIPGISNPVLMKEQLEEHALENGKVYVNYKETNNKNNQ